MILAPDMNIETYLLTYLTIPVLSLRFQHLFMNYCRNWRDVVTVNDLELPVISNAAVGIVAHVTFDRK